MSGILTGWVEDRDAADAFCERPDIGEAYRTVPHLQTMAEEQKDTALWKPLLRMRPNWKRVRQGIGDCVSHGGELCATMTMAIKHEKGEGTFEAEAASEPMYGGARVEFANNGRQAGYSDGTYGAALVGWLLNGGVVLRKDYRQETGNEEHDLRNYSAERAKAWGNFGCGGARDARGDGPLDKIARQMPYVQATRVTDPMLAAYAIQSGYPVVTCSKYGFGGMRRNSEGIVRIQDTWYHCMMLGGVRWRRGAPDFRNFQSWGGDEEDQHAVLCSGPDPGITEKSISLCSWWIVAEDMQKILAMKDSYILSDIKGMPIQKLPTLEMSDLWNLKK